MNISGVWNYYDRVRGLLDQQTIFDISVYALLFKKAEIDKIKAYKEQYSLSFLSIVYGERVSSNDLVGYIKEIEEEYGIQDGILSESFSSIASRVTDASKVKAVFNTMYGMKIESKEDLMIVYDGMVNSFGVTGGRMQTESGTTRSLAKLEAVLLNAGEGEEIYDGYCGLGISLVEAGNSTNRYYIRDINRDVLAKAVISLIVHDRKIESAICGDSNIEDERKFDNAISEPPFNVRKDPKYLSSADPEGKIICSNSLEIERIIGSLKQDGRAVILVPAGLLFSGGKVAEFRRYLIGKYMIDNSLVDAVVGLPTGVLPGTLVNAMLLVINKGKKDNNILMVNSESFWHVLKSRELTLGQDGIDALKDIVLSRKVIDSVSTMVTPEDIIDKDMNMSPNIYVNPYKIEDAKVEDVKNLYDKEKALLNEFDKINSALLKIRAED